MPPTLSQKNQKLLESYSTVKQTTMKFAAFGFAIGLGFCPWIRSGGDSAPRELYKITGLTYLSSILDFRSPGSSNQSSLGVQQFEEQACEAGLTEVRETF